MVGLGLVGIGLEVCDIVQEDIEVEIDQEDTDNNSDFDQPSTGFAQLAPAERAIPLQFAIACALNNVKL